MQPRASKVGKFFFRMGVVCSLSLSVSLLWIEKVRRISKAHHGNLALAILHFYGIIASSASCASVLHASALHPLRIRAKLEALRRTLSDAYCNLEFFHSSCEKWNLMAMIELCKFSSCATQYSIAEVRCKIKWTHIGFGSKKKWKLAYSSKVFGRKPNISKKVLTENPTL